MGIETTHDEEGFLILKGELFWKWRALSEVIQRLAADLQLHAQQIDKLLEPHPEIRELFNKRASLNTQMLVARGEYSSLLGELEAHLGFPMKNVSIDDVSGRVHRLEEGAPAAPAAEAPAPKQANGINGHAKPKIAPVPPVKSSAPGKKPKKRK